MKYTIKTKNENGVLKMDTKIHPKDRRKVLYLVVDETNNTQVVDKKWVIANIDDITNVGLSGNSLYLKSKGVKKKTKSVVIRKDVPYEVVNRAGGYRFPGAGPSVKKAFELEGQGYKVVVNDMLMSAEAFQSKCKKELTVPGACNIRFYNDVSEYVDDKNKVFYCKLGAIRTENMI